MSRMVSGRPKQREGRGLGETLSESFIFILMGVGLVAGAYWYFMIYQKSPQVALQGYLGALNSGNIEAQFNKLSENTKSKFKSKDDYDNKVPIAHGLAARIANFSIKNGVLSGDKWEGDVTMNVRQKTENLLATGSDSFNDHYVLVKEATGWKVDLVASKIDPKETQVR